MALPDYYAILGVPKHASQKIIGTAYFAQHQAFQKSINDCIEGFSTADMTSLDERDALLTLAYDTLKIDATRQEYNKLREETKIPADVQAELTKLKATLGAEINPKLTAALAKHTLRGERWDTFKGVLSAANELAAASSSSSTSPDFKTFDEALQTFKSATNDPDIYHGGFVKDTLLLPMRILNEILQFALLPIAAIEAVLTNKSVGETKTYQVFDKIDKVVSDSVDYALTGTSQTSAKKDITSALSTVTSDFKALR